MEPSEAAATILALVWLASLAAFWVGGEVGEAQTTDPCQIEWDGSCAPADECVFSWEGWTPQCVVRRRALPAGHPMVLPGLSPCANALEGASRGKYALVITLLGSAASALWFRRTWRATSDPWSEGALWQGALVRIDGELRAVPGPPPRPEEMRATVTRPAGRRSIAGPPERPRSRRRSTTV